MSLSIQEMKIAEEKSKSSKNLVLQTTDDEQPKKSAGDQHPVHEVICNALLVKRWIFPIQNLNRRLAI